MISDLKSLISLQIMKTSPINKYNDLVYYPKRSCPKKVHVFFVRSLLGYPQARVAYTWGGCDLRYY